MAAGACQPLEFELCVLRALSALADPPGETGPRREAMDTAASCLEQLRSWASPCPQNFQHLEHLVAAETAAVTGELTRAGPLYSLAVDTAAANGFPQWAGLSAARWARHVEHLDRAQAAALHLLAAEHYRDWGAGVPAESCREAAYRCSADPASRTTSAETSGPRAASST
jgi:hypothetical protein